MFEDQALSLDQKPIEELLAAGKEFHRRHKYSKACRWLREVVARDPLRGEAHYWSGAALVRRERYRDAIHSLLEATRLGFYPPDVQLRLGEAYQAQSERWLDPEAERRDRREQALGAFARAIDLAETTPYIDGSVAEAHLGAARVQAACSQPNEALAHLEAALRAAPDTAAVHQNAQEELRKLLAGRADLDARLASLRGIIHRAKRPEPYSALAGTLAALGRPDAAFWEYLWALWRYAKLRGAGHAEDLELPPFDWERLALSDAPAAVAKRERLLRRGAPPLVEVAIGLGLLTGGTVEPAISVLARALKRAPADPSIYALLRQGLYGGQNLEVGQKQKLLETLGTVVRCWGPAEAWTKWGNLLVVLGMSEDAGGVFHYADAEGHITWATLLMERDHEQALAKLTHAVDLAEDTGTLGAWLASSVRVLSQARPGEWKESLGSGVDAIGSIIIKIYAAHGGRRTLVDRVERNLLPTTRPEALKSWARTLALMGRAEESSGAPATGAGGERGEGQFRGVVGQDVFRVGSRLRQRPCVTG